MSVFRKFQSSECDILTEDTCVRIRICEYGSDVCHWGMLFLMREGNNTNPSQSATQFVAPVGINRLLK